MGYLSRISGTMNLSRELTHSEVVAVEKLLAGDPGSYWFGLDSWEDEEETPNGRVIAKSADSIVVAYDDSGKAYTALQELQVLISALPEDVTLSGQFRRIGEEAPDISRYALDEDGRSVIEETPRLVWPDGSEEPVRR